MRGHIARAWVGMHPLSDTWHRALTRAYPHERPHLCQPVSLPVSALLRMHTPRLIAYETQLVLNF